MANQIIIDIGAVANDGTGDPLRTAFGYVNNNFSNVWATGVANSNIAFDGNRILTTNTNGNLVLSPNGIGKVQANVDIIPSANNSQSLGSLTRQWNTVYAQNLDISGALTSGDLSVDGNLTVTGNTIQIGNIVTDTKTIQLANTAGTANAANGSGITVGANDNIATLLYSSASNVWSTNIGLTVTGNLTTFTGTVSSNNINFTNDLFGKTGTFTGDESGDNSIYAGVPLFTSLGTDVIAQFSGNVNAYTQFNFQNGNTGTQASGDYVITADNGNDTTHFINLGITSSGWDGSQPNSLGNRLGPNDGYLYIQDGDMVIGTSNGNIETWKFDQTGNLTVPGDIIPTGNNTQNLGSATNQWADLYISNATIFMNGVPITLGAGNVLTVNGEPVLTNDSTTSISTTGNITADYFFGNGSQLTGLSTSSISNGTSNVDIPVANGNVIINTSGTYAWTFDNTGNLTIPGTISSSSTIGIDNRASGNSADIQLFAADDITIQARDRSAGSTAEGGDINILAGDSAEDGDSSGGDIQIIAGDGGAANVDFGGAGGFITIRSGQGGSAIGDGVSSAESGGALTLQAGDAGGNNGNIDRGAAGGDVFITAGDSTGNLATGGDIVLTTGTGGANASAGQIELNVPSSDAGPGGTWSFNYTGDLNLPNNGSINFNAGGIVQAVDEDFSIRVQDADDDGFALLLQVDDGAGTVLGSTELQRDRYVVQFAGGGAPQFTFNENGEFSVPGNIRATEYVDTSLYSVSDNVNNGSVELKVISYAGDTLGSNIRVSQSNATISTGNAQHTWNFDNTGVLTFPDGANIVDGAFNGTASSTVSLNAFSPDGNTVSFQAQGNTSSAVISIFSNAGPVTSNWTFTTAPLDPSESFLYVPNGGAISTPNASGGEGGKNIFIQAGASDPVTWNSNPGGELFIKGGYGSFGDGGGGPGGNVNIEGGTSSDSHAGNVNITCGPNSWVFDYSGNVTIPGNINAVMSSPAPSLNGFDIVNAVTVNASGNISGGNLITTGSLTLPNSSVLTFGDVPVTNRYYVDATRTDTYTQNGSQARPFKTIAAAQAAIATAISGGLNPEVEPIYIILLSNITENVSLTTNHVYLIGQNGQIHQPIILTGNITVNPTSGTLNSNHFSITGMEIVGGTNGKAIYVTGSSPLRLSLQDVWITANGTGAGLYQDNTGTGTYTHGGPLKVSHNGSGDVYCFDIRKGTASFDTVETSGATQVGAAGPGATLTFNNSQLDANGDVVVETYGNGTVVVTNSVIKNAAANSYGIKLNAVANVAGTVSVGQSAFNVPAGTGQAVWLDPNTTPGLSGVFAWSGASFYPNTNTTIAPLVIPAPLAILVGTIANPILYGDITSYAVAQDWDLIDNNASALSFDTTGKAGVLELVTTNSAEGVKMSGYANVVGNIVTGGQIQSSAFTGGNISWAANNRTDFQGAIKVGGTGQILSPGGAASITLNNNGANIPILGVTNTSNSTSTTTGALIVSGGAGVAGNVYVGGNIVGNTAGFAIGYRDIPQVSFTGNATIATTDAGKHFYSTQSSNYTLTIANNASQGFQVGAAITVVNQGTGTITITYDPGVTLYLAGNATAGNRSISTFGMATIMKVATDTWFINGTGVS